MIHQINKKIFRLLDEYKNYLGFIIMNADSHGSSDDEDEIQAKHENYLHIVHSYRPKMRKISEILNSILTFRVIPDPNPNDKRNYKSNTFTMEYPKNSGNIVEFPEVDKIGFFSSSEAKDKLNPAQSEFIKRWENISKKTDH